MNTKLIGRFLVLCMVLSLVWVPSLVSKAVGYSSVTVNGAAVSFANELRTEGGVLFVPAQEMLDALGYTTWLDEENQTVSGLKNGKMVAVTQANDLVLSEEGYCTLAGKTVVFGGVLYAPIQLVGSLTGCSLAEGSEEGVAAITCASTTLSYYEDISCFTQRGTWTVENGALMGKYDRDPSTAQPAKAMVKVARGGDYKVWVLARDYPDNRPGQRYFTISVDHMQSQQNFGNHGQEGFRWQEAGTFPLEKGIHELQLLDTSGYHARCAGVFLTTDLNFVPTEELERICPSVGPAPELTVRFSPAWAREEFPVLKTAVLENEKFKVVFYQGQSEMGSLVQNAVFLKDGADWVPVKQRDEELAFLMMSAEKSTFGKTEGEAQVVHQLVQTEYGAITLETDHFYETGTHTWLLPSDFEQLSDHEIRLSFSSDQVDFQVSYTLGPQTEEPLVTLQAVFQKAGAYSFLLYHGDGVAYEAFDTVTAPLLYVKHALPEDAVMVAEPFLFTPMNTLYFTAAQNQAGNGKELTKGLAVDPSSVSQGFSYPETAAFGTVFYTPEGKVRPQLAAPLFGGGQCNFSDGQSYTFSYRILSSFGGWYDTFRHVAEDLYQVEDLRTNYNTSLNETIGNATQLWLDDYYGGWDQKAMSYYNMEARDVTTQANPLEAVQRYLLTEDPQILEQRAVPTLAYLLSRMSKSFKYNDTEGGLISTYVGTQLPSSIGGPVDYSASVYAGLYEMTQGRMPFLLQYALDGAEKKTVPSLSAIQKLTGDEQVYQQIIQAADAYLTTHCNAGANREKRFVGGFIYNDYVRMVNTFLIAYEYTGEQKYLDAAEEGGRLLCTGLWNTGYQNDYAQRDYQINASAGARPHPNDSNPNFFWHGDTKWRPGNPKDGSALSPIDLGQTIAEATVPGWLPAQTGLGAEHPSSPKYGAVNQMNLWAGTMIRLSYYTGDTYFRTQARNAMLGRFGNYTGYGRERYLVHQMDPAYPYTGPDYTMIYYHHIPVFMAMLEDYLVNEAWARSNKQVSFPMLYQLGYAYFDTNQFGQEPGRFYDQADMWLWMKEGILTAQGINGAQDANLDYVAARKDGVLGLALLNEDNCEAAYTIALGNAVPGGSDFSGSAVLYDENGNTAPISVENGSFTVSIPAKGMRGALLAIDSVTRPSYAKEYQVSGELGQTVSAHARGKGYVIQLNDSQYHAYVYVTDQDLQKLEMTYTAGGEPQVITADSYPFEFLVPVPDPNIPFTYTLKAFTADGTQEDLGGGELKTLAASEIRQPGEGEDIGGTQSNEGTKIVPLGTSTAPAFEPVQLSYARMGRSGAWKFIIDPSAFPFPVNQANLDQLINLSVVSVWNHKTEDTVITAQSYITKAEMADNNTKVAIYVKYTSNTPGSEVSFDNADYNVGITLYHDPPEGIETGTASEDGGAFAPFSVLVRSSGRSSSDWRFIVNLADIPFPVAEDTLKDALVHGTLTHKTTGEVVYLDSVVKANEKRDTTTVLVIPSTAEVPSSGEVLFDESQYTISLQISPPPDPSTLPFDLVPITLGRSANHWRFVVKGKEIPFVYDTDSLTGYLVESVWTHKTTGEQLVLESVISANEVRVDGTVVLVVPETEAVPASGPNAVDNGQYQMTIKVIPYGIQVSGGTLYYRTKKSGVVFTARYDAQGRYLGMETPVPIGKNSFGQLPVGQIPTNGTVKAFFWKDTQDTLYPVFESDWTQVDRESELKNDKTQKMEG